MPYFTEEFLNGTRFLNEGDYDKALGNLKIAARDEIYAQTLEKQAEELINTKENPLSLLCLAEALYSQENTPYNALGAYYQGEAYAQSGKVSAEVFRHAYNLSYPRREWNHEKNAKAAEIHQRAWTRIQEIVASEADFSR